MLQAQVTGAAFVLSQAMETTVYIDGFNLYYRLLNSRPALKWLDLEQIPLDFTHSLRA